MMTTQRSTAYLEVQLKVFAVEETAMGSGGGSPVGGGVSADIKELTEE